MRTELHLEGHNVGKLGSPRDVTLRKFLAKKKNAESNRLMVLAAASFNNEEVVKKTFAKYQDSVWYTDISGNRDREMQEYYANHVKHLRPELYQDEDGMTAVRGL